MESNESLVLHLKNIFHLVRNFLIENDNKIIKIDSNKEEIQKKIELGAEKVIVDYIFKNFKNPLKILNTKSKGEIINREGEIDHSFLILPIDGIVNYINGIRLVGMAIAIIDNTKPFGLSAVTHGLIGNIYSGDAFIATPGKVYLNDDKLIIPDEIALKDAIISAPIPRKHTRPLRKIAKLSEKADQIVYYGSPTLECTMALTGKVGAYVDLRNDLTLQYLLPHVYIFKQLNGFISTFDDIDLDNLPIDFTKGYNIILSLHQKLFEKMMKMMSRIEKV